MLNTAYFRSKVDRAPCPVRTPERLGTEEKERIGFEGFDQSLVVIFIPQAGRVQNHHQSSCEADLLTVFGQDNNFY